MNIQQSLRKMAELREVISKGEKRISDDILIREVRLPTYDDAEFGKLFTELDTNRLSLLALKKAVDKANHVVSNGKSVFALLVERDSISQRLSFYTILRQAGEPSEHWSRRDEPKVTTVKRVTDKDINSTIDALTALRRSVDDDICLLNATIQVEI